MPSPLQNAHAMSAYLAHLRGGPRHGQTTEIAQPALCLLLPEHDGEAVYDLCAARDFRELIYRYSHTDRGEPLEDSSPTRYGGLLGAPNIRTP